MTTRAKPSDLTERLDGRRYERPRILSREKLEAIATVCTPSPPAKADPGMCPSGPINS